MTLKWWKTWDDKDREVHEATSPYHDEGNFFLFRIVEKVPGSFILISDAELMTPKNKALVFDDLESAKAHCERDYVEILKAEGIAT